MEFRITEKQLEVIANALAEMPYRLAFKSFEIIQQLKPIEKTEEKEKK